MKNTLQHMDFSSLKEGVDYPDGMDFQTACMFIDHFWDFPGTSVRVWTTDGWRWELRDRKWTKVEHDPLKPLPEGQPHRIDARHITSYNPPPANLALKERE